MNLLEETEEVLEEHGKTFDDVLWIGGDDFTISVDDFKTLADREYYNGYGSPEVAIDLKVVGDGWWLERYEYDGAEDWAFKTMPEKPKEERKIKRVITNEIGWDSLEEMN
jgi:hypothetical protein